MKKLYMTQKLISVSEKFTVVDEQDRPCYFVEGSFMKIPKSFRILNGDQQEIATITKKVFSLLPKFFVEVQGKEAVVIEKKLTFMREKYHINAQGIEVQGNWWDMDFQVFYQGEAAAEIHKRWLSLRDTYEITVLNEKLQDYIISLVIAIDRVKADSSNS